MKLPSSRERVQPGIDPKSYEAAYCRMPDCEAPLWITHEMSRPIYLSDTSASLRNTQHSYTGGWYIECELGHRVLLPVGSDEYERFGLCRYDESDHTDGTLTPGFCAHYDMERLRKVSRRGDDTS